MYRPKTEKERGDILALVVVGMMVALTRGQTSEWLGVTEEAELVVPRMLDPIAQRVHNMLLEAVDGDQAWSYHYLEELALACAADVRGLVYEEDDA